MLLAELGGVLELNESVLAALEKILEDNSEETDWTPYQNLRLSAGAFGGSDKGSSLNHHHTRAHQVVAETIKEMLVELRGFAEGVRNAAAVAKTADETAAQDLAKRANEVHATDQNAYHHARNDQNVVPVDPTPSEAATSSSAGDGEGGPG